MIILWGNWFLLIVKLKTQRSLLEKGTMTDLIHQTLAQRRRCLVGGLPVVLHRGQLSDRSQSHCMCQGEMIHLYVGKANRHTLSELPHRQHSIYDMQQEIVWPEQFQSHLQVDVPPCCGTLSNWTVSFHRGGVVPIKHFMKRKLSHVSTLIYLFSVFFFLSMFFSLLQTVQWNVTVPGGGVWNFGLFLPKPSNSGLLLLNTFRIFSQLHKGRGPGHNRSSWGDNGHPHTGPCERYSHPGLHGSSQQ